MTKRIDYHSWSHSSRCCVICRKSNGLNDRKQQLKLQWKSSWPVVRSTRIEESSYLMLQKQIGSEMSWSAIQDTTGELKGKRPDTKTHFDARNCSWFWWKRIGRVALIPWNEIGKMKAYLNWFYMYNKSCIYRYKVKQNPWKQWKRKEIEWKIERRTNRKEYITRIVTRRIETTCKGSIPKNMGLTYPLALKMD